MRRRCAAQGSLTRRTGVGCADGFTVGHRRETQTKGVWLSRRVRQRAAPDGTNMTVIYVDTEGFEGTGQARAHVHSTATPTPTRTCSSTSPPTPSRSDSLLISTGVNAGQSRPESPLPLFYYTTALLNCYTTAGLSLRRPDLRLRHSGLFRGGLQPGRDHQGGRHPPARLLRSALAGALVLKHVKLV